MANLEAPEITTKLKKVSTILITQAEPPAESNPYAPLTQKYKIKVDFRPFIEIQGVPFKEFRKTKINPLDFTAVIFTSKNAVDHYFRICTEAKIEMPADMKYFCVTEQTANYLQKYITIRKRKIFSGLKTAADLCEIIKKHKGEKFIFPCSNIRTPEIPNFLEKNGIVYQEAIMYGTVSSDIKDLDVNKYDIICFFSPSGVESLLQNFPDFQQNDIRLAAFGPTTAKAVTDANLNLDVLAPMPNAPSMTGALELYVKKANGIK